MWIDAGSSDSRSDLLGARAVGAEKSYGTVEPRKVADLTILREDPSTNIRNTRTIVAVVKGGVVYRR